MLCPCWIGEDPDGGTCESVVAYHFDRGTVRGVDVTGLTVASVVLIPGNILEGNWKQVLFIDDGASDEQYEALEALFKGELGGPMRRPDGAGRASGLRSSARRSRTRSVDGAGTLDGRRGDKSPDASLQGA